MEKDMEVLEDDVVIAFKKEDPFFGCFSNYFTSEFDYKGVHFHSAEAAFQGMKGGSLECLQEFAMMSPSDAKKAGRSVELRPDWEQIKDQVMYEVCLAKFMQNPQMASTLLKTDDMTIVEDTTGWHDNYWGICCCPKCATKVKKNMLGCILMGVRRDIKAMLKED